MNTIVPSADKEISEKDNQLFHGVFTLYKNAFDNTELRDVVSLQSGHNYFRGKKSGVDIDLNFNEWTGAIFYSSGIQVSPRLILQGDKGKLTTEDNEKRILDLLVLEDAKECLETMILAASQKTTTKSFSLLTSLRKRLLKLIG